MPKREHKRQSSGAAEAQPISGDDAARPLSVGLFLAVFLPAAGAAGTALLALLLKSYNQSEALTKLADDTADIEKSLDALTLSSEQLLHKEVPDLKLELASLRMRLDQRDAPAK
jgi:hypothetical protein